MLSLLRTPQENERLYSFGKVTAKLGGSRYELSFRDRRIVISTEKEVRVGTWVRIYGTCRRGSVRTRLVETLSGLDINLLERAVSYVTKKLQKEPTACQNDKVY
jgi:hypothetical protein